MPLESARSLNVSSSATTTTTLPIHAASARSHSQRRNTTGGTKVDDGRLRSTKSMSLPRSEMKSPRKLSPRRHSLTTTPSVSAPSAAAATTAWEVKALELKAKKERKAAETKDIKALVKKRNSATSLSVSESVQRPLMKLVSHVTPPRAFAAPTPPRSPTSMFALANEVESGLLTADRLLDDNKERLRTVTSFKGLTEFRRTGSAFNLGSTAGGGDTHNFSLSRTGSRRTLDSNSDSGENHNRNRAGSSTTDSERLPHLASWSKQYPTIAVAASNNNTNSSMANPQVTLHQTTPLSISNHSAVQGGAPVTNPPNFESSFSVNDGSTATFYPTSSLKRVVQVVPPPVGDSDGDCSNNTSARKVASFRLEPKEAQSDVSPTLSASRHPVHPTKSTSMRRSSQSRRSVVAARNQREEDRMYNKHFDNVEKFQYSGIGELQGIGGKVLDEYYAEMQRMNLEEDRDRRKMERSDRYKEQVTSWNSNTANAIPSTMLSGAQHQSASDVDRDTPTDTQHDQQQQRRDRNASKTVIVSDHQSSSSNNNLAADSFFGAMEESTNIARPPPFPRRRSTKTVTLVETSGSDTDSPKYVASPRRRSSLTGAGLAGSPPPVAKGGGGSLADQLYGKKNSGGLLSRKTSGGCVDESYLQYQRDQRRIEERRRSQRKSSSGMEAAAAAAKAAAANKSSNQPTTNSSSSSTRLKPKASKTFVVEDRKAIKALRVVVRSLEGSEYIERVCLEDREKRDLKEIAVSYLVELQRVLDTERAQLLADRESDRQDKRNSLHAMGFCDEEIDYRWEKELQQGMMQRTRPNNRNNSLLGGGPSPPGSTRNLLGAFSRNGRATPSAMPRTKSDLSAAPPTLSGRAPSWRNVSRSASPSVRAPNGGGRQHSTTSFGSPSSLNVDPHTNATANEILPVLESGGESSDDENEGAGAKKVYDAPNQFFDVFLTYDESIYNDAQSLEENVLDEPCSFPVYVASGCGQHHNFKFIKEPLSKAVSPSPTLKRNSSIDDVALANKYGSRRSSAESQTFKKSNNKQRGSSIIDVESLPKGSYMLLPYVQQGNSSISAGQLVLFDHKPLYAQLKQEHKIESLVSGYRRRSLQNRKPSYRRLSRTTSPSRSPSPQHANPPIARRSISSSLPPVPPSTVRKQLPTDSSTNLPQSPKASSPNNSSSSFSPAIIAHSPRDSSRAGSFQRGSPASSSSLGVVVGAVGVPTLHINYKTPSSITVPPPTAVPLSDYHLQVTPKGGPNPIPNNNNDDLDSEYSPSNCLSNTLRAFSPRSPVGCREGAFDQTHRAERSQPDDDDDNDDAYAASSHRSSDTQGHSIVCGVDDTNSGGGGSISHPSSGAVGVVLGHDDIVQPSTKQFTPQPPTVHKSSR